MRDVNGVAWSRAAKSYRPGGREFEHEAQQITKGFCWNGPATPRALTFELTLEKASILVSRGGFLATVSEAEPEVLHSLAARPLQVLAEELSRFPGLLIFDWRHVQYTRSFRGFRSAVEEWSRSWNLTDVWCLEWAVQTLSWWQQQPGAPRDQWFHEDLDANPATDIDFPSFELPPSKWNPLFRTRSDFAEETRNIFEARLRDYLNRIEQSLKALRLAKTPEFRNPEHTYWLARYQVKGELPRDIARGRGIDACWSEDGNTPAERQYIGRKRDAATETVRKGIARRAELIGLTLRSKLKPMANSPTSKDGT